VLREEKGADATIPEFLAIGLGVLSTNLYYN